MGKNNLGRAPAASGNIEAGTDPNVRMEMSCLHIAAVAMSIPSAAIRNASDPSRRAAIEAAPTQEK